MTPASAITLYARETPGFADRVAGAGALLAAAAASYPGRIVQASSFGAEDQVVTDLVSRLASPIAVATLDTGMLHRQTLELVETTEARYGIAVERFRPLQESVIAFVGRHGPDAMYESVDLRKACCGMRKVEPLARMLDGREAWVTGLRREQSNERGEVPFEEIDGHGRAKLSPLADWSWADVWNYIRTYDVPYHPLHDAFYPSIGCAPCTRAVALGEDFRAGRWWWEQGIKECGLHVEPLAPPAAVPLETHA